MYAHTPRGNGSSFAQINKCPTRNHNELRKPSKSARKRRNYPRHPVPPPPPSKRRSGTYWDKPPVRRHRPADPLPKTTAEERAWHAEFDATCPLTDLQHRAIEYLVLGLSEAQVVAKLGINRKTLWRWKSFDHDFRHALALCRAQVHESNIDRYQHVLQEATDVLVGMLKDQDAGRRFKAAYAFLCMSTAYRPTPYHKVTPLDPDPLPNVPKEMA